MRPTCRFHFAIMAQAASNEFSTDLWNAASVHASVFFSHNCPLDIQLSGHTEVTIGNPGLFIIIIPWIIVHWHFCNSNLPLFYYYISNLCMKVFLRVCSKAANWIKARQRNCTDSKQNRKRSVGSSFCCWAFSMLGVATAGWMAEFLIVI